MNGLEDSGEKSKDNVDNSIDEGIIHYQDFFPSVDPSSSTCFSKGYVKFSEIVQDANEWLRVQKKIEVVNCEVVPVSHVNNEVIIQDSWPSTFYLRGLRLWWRRSTLELSDTEALEKRRFLLGFRDFIPKVDRRSVFKGQYENAHEILMRINDYISSKSTPSKVLALQTLDCVSTGYVESNADTEDSVVSISQHGFTRFIRFLRVFFLTQYPKVQSTDGPSLDSLPRIDIKDFLPKPGDEDGVSTIIARCLKWCSVTQDVALLNLQVLSCRAGLIDTNASTWSMESPGHIPNKFTNFVRVAYMSSNIATCGVTSVFLEVDSSKRPSLQNETEAYNNGIESDNLSGSAQSCKVITVRPSGSEEDDSLNEIDISKEIDKEEGDDASEDSEETKKEKREIEALSIIPVYEEIKKRYLTSKAFAPEKSKQGAICGSSSFEQIEDVMRRMNEWVSIIGNPIQIHTQSLYFKGDVPDLTKTMWLKYFPVGSWIPVFHVIIDPTDAL